MQTVSPSSSPSILPDPVRRNLEDAVRMRADNFAIVDVRATVAQIRQRFPGDDLPANDLSDFIVRFAGQCGVTVPDSSPFAFVVADSPTQLHQALISIVHEAAPRLQQPQELSRDADLGDKPLCLLQQ